MPDTKLIVGMAGGGADAYPMMRALLDALPLVLEQQRVALVLIAGPFMPAEQRHDLEARARSLPARIRVSVNDSLSYIDAPDLVVGMAGYNTTTEILRSGKPAILIPRVGPSAEQRMRATLFSERGWVDMIDPTRLEPATVAQALLARLAAPERPGVARPDVGGLSVAAELLSADLALPSAVSAPRARRAPRKALLPLAS
jgi:predicted glycosyltransferase